MPNTLYYGDNLDILRRKVRDESVDLCYIDPPFNSKRNYFQIYNNIGKDDAAQTQAFIDTWTWNELAMAGYQEIITNFEGRYTRQTIELMKGLRAVLGDNGLLAYLISMAQRVNEIWRVLKPTGSFYLHCDPTASHYLKLVLDSVFCPRGGDFLNEISWKRTYSHGSAKRYGPLHDVILFYAKTDNYLWNGLKADHNPDYINKHFRYNDVTGKKFQAISLTGAGVRYGESGKPWRGINPTTVGRHWALPSKVLSSLKIENKTVQEALDALDSAGRIYWPNKEGGTPRLKWYTDDSDGIVIADMWTDIGPISAQATERLGYPTQKPEALLERIIQASSNEGDTILDAYCGCGTSVAVSQRLRRNWIGIDITYQSIAVILKRLEDSFGADVLDTITLDGIPRDMESARALANKKDDRVRKEFEKWALLTYSKNRATLNEKKGADKGVDGTAYFVTGHEATERVIFQVKSGGVKRNDIATLRGDMAREAAALGVFITLEDSTKPMRDEALAAGVYHHALLNRDYPRIQIVTVREMIEENRRIDLPLSLDVLKSAAPAKTDDQQALALD